MSWLAHLVCLGILSQPTPIPSTSAFTTSQSMVPPLPVSKAASPQSFTPPPPFPGKPTPPPLVQAGTSVMGHTDLRSQGSGGRGHVRDLVGQQSEATGLTVTQTTIDQVLGSLHQSQDMMGQILTELRGMKQLQRENNVQMENLHCNFGSLTGVLPGNHTHMCRAFPAPSTPFCSSTASGPSTSATEREALPEEETPNTHGVPATVDHPTPRMKERPSKLPAGDEGKTSTTTTTKKHRTELPPVGDNH